MTRRVEARGCFRLGRYVLSGDRVGLATGYCDSPMESVVIIPADELAALDRVVALARRIDVECANDDEPCTYEACVRLGALRLAIRKLDTETGPKPAKGSVG